jgi:hypothetical protein
MVKAIETIQYRWYTSSSFESLKNYAAKPQGGKGFNNGIGVTLLTKWVRAVETNIMVILE